MTAMIELSIRFTSDEKDETSLISVSLFRPDTGVSTDLAPFDPPLDDDVLAELRWYLEIFAVWPTGPDYGRAELIKPQLEGWGRALLESVIAGPKAARLWQQFADAGEDKLLTIDATDPRVLRLPWELLADEGGHIFAQGIGVRRRLQQATAAPVKPFDKLRAGSFDLPVRVLILVSRPEGAGFIDPRAVSIPLLDALDELGGRVATEFLYPPTQAALTKRLRDRKAPPVHVVHFDGHGVYDASQGLGYLLFEDQEHEKDMVDADQLGTLLNRCGVPLMVLNACQSAKQEEANPYASVAARLIRAGVGSVLAMNYSVLVVATRKFVDAFYSGLAGGLSIGRAVDEGRFALLSDEKRHTLTRRDPDGSLREETVRLRDWFLPALYQQSADPIVFASLPSPPPLVPLSPPPPVFPSPGGLPRDPLHGFHGRAREMLHLERALAERSIVVLHGFGGVGKTALAAEAGRWFHRTGRFPGGAAFVSFEHGGSLSTLCSWVGQAVSGDPDFVIGEGDPVERIIDRLRERPALVILDNFESVLGPEPLMPVGELREVLDAVGRWGQGDKETRGRGDKGTGSRVLITTRDTTFNDARFAPSRDCAHVELGGLATRDALALAAAVLDAHTIDRATVGRQELVDLMEHLGGHPLSLYLVLPHLREYSPAELTARFEGLLPGFRTGAAQERNESLAVSLEFSLRRLGDETRAALPALGVFQGGAMEERLLEITQIDPELWPSARAEMEQAALVSVESLPGVNVPFLRFHPTLAPHLAAQLDAARRAGLEEWYWQRYHDLARYLYKADTQTPHQARIIAQREMPNLRRALDLCLAAGAVAEAVGFADSIARFLNNFGRWRERDAMMEKVSKFVSGQVASGEGVTKAEVLVLNQRGDVLLQQGRATEAERLFRGLLERLEVGVAYDAAYDHAMTLMRLGRCLAARGRPVLAIEYHQQALAELERIGESARQMTGAVHTDLAGLYMALGQFDDAEREYEAALVIDEELSDGRGKGVDLGQLGTLAMQRGDLAEAARRYTEALETFRTLGEPQSEAVIWHQLGRVAEEAREWDEAERCYRESLKLKDMQGDLPGVAGTCNQLAIVAEGAGRLNDAARWYLRAIELGEQLSDHRGLAARLNNLANLYFSQGHLDEAARYAHRAMEIQETLDLSSEPWKTFNILAQIAVTQGQADVAATWRRKEQESYATYAGSRQEMRVQQQELYRQTMVILKERRLSDELGEIDLQLAALYERQMNFAEAAKYLFSAFRYYEGSQNTQKMFEAGLRLFRVTVADDAHVSLATDQLSALVLLQEARQIQLEAKQSDLQLTMEIARLLHDVGRTAEAIELLRGELDNSSLSHVDRAQVLYRLGVAYDSSADYNSASEYLHECCRILEGSGTRDNLAQALLVSARCKGMMKQTEESLNQVERVWEIASEVGDQLMDVEVLSTKVRVLQNAGESIGVEDELIIKTLEAGMHLRKRVVDSLADKPSGFPSAEELAQLHQTAVLKGREQLLKVEVSERVELLIQQARFEGCAYPLHPVAQLFASLWQLGQVYERPWKRIEGRSTLDTEAQSLDFERAANYYARAQKILDSNEGIFSDIHLLRGHIAYQRARCFEQVGQWNEASKEADRAVTSYELARNVEFIGRAALLSAALYQRLRQDERARQRYYYARSLFEKLGDTSRVASTKVQLGILLVRQGATEAALEELDDARRIYTKDQKNEMVDQVNELIDAALLESKVPIDENVAESLRGAS